MDEKEYYIQKLRETAAREARLPKKSDFCEEDVNRIKGLFGPWPWALEAAGLKESKHEKQLEHNREKRSRARENRKKNNSEQPLAEN